MAQGEVANGSHPEVLELAEEVVAAQEAEFTERERMLQELPCQS